MSMRSKVSGACTPIVGCKPDGGLHARNRTPATNSAGTPVGARGGARPLHVTAWRPPVIPVTFTCSRSTEESQAPRGGIGRIQLVDRKFRAVCIAGKIGQQMPEQSIGKPRRRFARFLFLRELLKGNFELVESVVACFVDARRLRRRADEHP